MEGYTPEYDVDHIDRDKSNNKWDNLRHATRSCNMQNKSMQSNNTSGVVGVYWTKSNNKWQASITINGKTINLGYYVNFEDAVRMRYNEEQNNSNWKCSTDSSALKYLKEKGLEDDK